MTSSSTNIGHAAVETAEASDDARAFMYNIASIMAGFFVSSRNNEQHTVVHVSDGFERIYGHDLAAFMSRGANYAALIHPDDLGPVSGAVERALLTGTKWQVQYRLKTATGEWRDVLETGAGRANRGKAIEYLDCIITDTAQLHDLESRLSSGGASVEAIAFSVKSIVGLLDTLRMLSLNARIEAALVPAGAGFNEVAKEMADLANTGDGLAKEISTHLRRLDRVLRYHAD